MRKFIITLIASFCLPLAAFADTYVKSLKPGAAFFFLPGSWLTSGGWVRIDVDKKKILLTHYYDVRDKLTGRRTRYMHPITATRACPIKTFDECIIGGNTIELPEGSTLGDYSYEIKWTEGGKNYTYKLEVEGLNPIDQEFKKKFIDEVKIRN